MFAGAPAVSVTLWSVESQSAKALSVGMYQHIKAGQTRAEALRDAKLQKICGNTAPMYRRPFFWAPVVLFGDAG